MCHYTSHLKITMWLGEPWGNQMKLELINSSTQPRGMMTHPISWWKLPITHHIYLSRGSHILRFKIILKNLYFNHRPLAKLVAHKNHVLRRNSYLGFASSQVLKWDWTNKTSRKLTQPTTTHNMAFYPPNIDYMTKTSIIL